jgi:uncharacterized membrane protein
MSDALVDMNEMIETYKFPTLIYVDNSNSQLQDIDGFVVYTFDGNPETALIKGFLAKRGNSGPETSINTNIINRGGVLLSGIQANGKKLSGWEYYSNQKIKNFIGTSLLLAIPRDMLNR